MDENMDENTSIEITDDSQELVEKILLEQNPDELKKLTALFNAAQSKKNIVRSLRFNELLDTICDEMQSRFSTNPYGIDNDQIIKWLKSVQGIVDKNNAYVESINDTPLIQKNIQVNNTINLIDSMSKESKDRVAEVVKNILLQNEGDIDTDE